MKNNLSIFSNVILRLTILITFGWLANSFAQAQCPFDSRLGKMSASDSKYYLPKDYLFKVKFEAPVSTDTYKTASIVQFTVIENVFGVRLPELENEADIDKFKREIDEILESYASEIDRILESALNDDDKNKRIKAIKADKIKQINAFFEPVRQKLESEISSKPDSELSKEEKEEKAKKKESISKIGETVIVIPKNSKGYGKVERAKRQLPLFLNYKARISVVLDYVLLDNGDCIPIEVRVSPDTRLYNEGDMDIGNVITCRSDGLKGKKCIKGRRPRFNFVTPILSGGATVATVLVKDPTAQALAGVTAIDQLTKGDLGNVINGADAQISEKLIYEVATTESRTGTIKKEDKK